MGGAHCLDTDNAHAFVLFKSSIFIFMIIIISYLLMISFTICVGISCEEAAVEDVSSDCSWNGVSCSAQVCPS